MIRQQALDPFRERFAEHILEVFDKSPRRVFVTIEPEAIVPMAMALTRDMGARFNIASGVDTRHHIEILYHFTLEDLNLMVNLRVRLDRAEPSIASLAPCFEGANWIEREIHEMLGVEFRGHPDMRRLLLPDDWPEGVQPLRRDYTEWDESAVRDRGV